MEMQRHAGPGGNWGEFIAWDPVKGKRVWSIKENLYVWSGAVVTGSDLVFYGTMDGWFRAVDARSGKVLWSQKLGSGITAAPMTFLGPDKRQYVAVYAGVGGGAGVLRRENGYHAGRQHALCLLDGWHGHRRRHHPACLACNSRGAHLGAARGSA